MKRLEAWCHWVEQEPLDEFSADRKLMAMDIRALLGCAKALEWYEENSHDLYGMDLDRGQRAREALKKLES